MAANLAKQSYAIRHFKCTRFFRCHIAMYGLYVTNSTEVEQPFNAPSKKRSCSVQCYPCCGLCGSKCRFPYKSARQLNDTLYAFHKVYLRARKPSAVLMIREEQPVAFETPSGRYEDRRVLLSLMGPRARSALKFLGGVQLETLGGFGIGDWLSSQT